MMIQIEKLPEHIRIMIEDPYEVTLRGYLTRFPTDHVFWFNLGSYLRTLGRLSEAESCLNEAVSICPDHLESWYELALLYEWMREYTLADRAWNHVGELRDEGCNLMEYGYKDAGVVAGTS